MHTFLRHYRLWNNLKIDNKKLTSICVCLGWGQTVRVVVQKGFCGTSEGLRTERQVLPALRVEQVERPIGTCNNKTRKISRFLITSQNIDFIISGTKIRQPFVCGARQCLLFLVFFFHIQGKLLPVLTARRELQPQQQCCNFSFSIHSAASTGNK